MRVAFKTADNMYPKSGNRELPVILDFTTLGTVSDTLFAEQSASEIESVKSVFIDNSQNNAALIIIFRKSQTRIVAQALTQGVYPVIEAGPVEYTATTTPGIKIPICFSNSRQDLMVWGPVPGVTVVPPLTNSPLEFQPLAAADNVLVLGVSNTTIKLYRQIMGFGAATNVKFWSGPSANNKPLTGTFNMFAGGSITMEPSGIPWMTTLPGDNLVMSSSVGVNMGGIIGFAQN